MSVSDLAGHSPRNSLYPLAAACGIVLGVLCLAGASGHFSAVWPVLDRVPAPPGGQRFFLLLPGVILLVTGLINVALCWALWCGRRWALQFALAANALALGYFAYLFARGVPDHPIGTFLASVASYVLLLAGIRLGLTWPAR